MSRNITFHYDSVIISEENAVKLMCNDSSFKEAKTLKKLNDLDTYEHEEYVTDLKGLKAMLKEKGVAIVHGILDENECTTMYNGAWDFIEHITSNWEIPISRDNEKSWKQFPDLFTLHSMLIQHHGIGHAQFLWELEEI